MNKEKLELWLVTILEGLVSRPDEIKVDVREDDMGVLFTVDVYPDDRGRVIGKGGTIASALRTLLRAAGMAGDIRASMRIEVPERPQMPV